MDAGGPGLTTDLLVEHMAHESRAVAAAKLCIAPAALGIVSEGALS